MQYKGGKGQDGVFQAIINLMRPHDRYFEGCLGGGSILAIKKPARDLNYGIDVESGAIARFEAARSRTVFSATAAPLKLLSVDVIAFLKIFPFTETDLIYLDPPYLFETRLSQRPIYKHEFTIEQHLELLSVITTLRAGILISGYDSDMYNTMLDRWRRVSFPAYDRQGDQRTEVVWVNYPEPMQLHDYRFLGRDFREREAIKRKIRTQERKLERMTSQARYAMLAATQNFITRAGDVRNADTADASSDG